ncbi:MAG TPA: hypothetical protein VEK38_00345 [Candidatus Bathyarchaeia archaeon]|nr:hypothetical protein [Candidatus Bathyarchaeia archaeon]
MKKILLNLLISCSLISHVLYISSAGQKKPTYAEMMAAKKNLTATPTSSSSDVGSTRKKKTRTPPPPAARLQTLNINDLIEQKWKYFDPSATSWLDLITNFENQNKREDIIRFAGEDKHSLEYMYRNNSITPFIYNNKKTKYESSDPSINEEYREFIGIGKDGTGQNMLGIAMTIVNWEIHNRRLATKLTNTWKSFNPSAKSWFDANIQSNATTLDATKERDLVLFFDQLANSQSTFGSKTLIYDNTKATYPNPSGNQARATQIENLRNSLGCGTKGKGDNVLGLALMEAREILQKQDIQKPSSQKEALLKKQQQRKQQKKLTKEEKTKLLNEPIKLQTKKSWSEGVNEFLGYVRTAIEYVVDTAISILSWGYNIFMHQKNHPQHNLSNLQLNLKQKQKNYPQQNLSKLQLKLNLNLKQKNHPQQKLSKLQLNLNPNLKQKKLKMRQVKKKQLLQKK